MSKYDTLGHPLEPDYRQGWEDGNKNYLNPGARTGEELLAYKEGFSEAVLMLEQEYVDDFGSDF